MLGPNPAVGDAPAFFDSDGSGGPSPCDQQIVPLYDPLSDVITIHTPYENCDGSNNFDNTFHLMRDINTFRPRSFVIASRANRRFHAHGFFRQPAGERPPRHLQMGGLIQSGDGHPFRADPDSSTGQGGQTFGNTSATMSLVFTGAGSGGSPLRFAPWSQVAGLGILATTCPTPVPQVFVPLSNGHIVLDLDCDGIPDPIFFSSPPSRSRREKEAGFRRSRAARWLLAAALVGVALFQLRRGGLGL
jgi:hypothetical protein